LKLVKSGITVVYYMI